MADVNPNFNKHILYNCSKNNKIDLNGAEPLELICSKIQNNYNFMIINAFCNGYIGFNNHFNPQTRIDLYISLLLHLEGKQTSHFPHELCID